MESEETKEKNTQEPGELEVEEIVSDEVDRQPAEKLKDLREKLKVCQQERLEYLDNAQRLKADYINLRKQVEAEKAAIIKFANEDLLLELLELADNFELAFQNKAAWEAVPESWRKGVEYIYSKLTNLFRKFNLEELNPLGEHFDPLKHHSIMSVDTQKKEEENIVLEVVQRGYILDGKLIRPAQVKVGHLIAIAKP